MKYPRAAVCAMAAVNVPLFFALGYQWERWGQTEWITLSCTAIFCSQGYLLGLWAAFGGKPTPWRAIFVVLIVVAWEWLLGFDSATMIVLGQTFIAMGVLFLARFLGLRLSKGKAEDHLGHLQFSVGQALLWMTAFVVFMAASHYLKDFFAVSYGAGGIFDFVFVLGVALAATWLACGRRWFALRCLAVLAMIGLGGAWCVRSNQLPWLQAGSLLGCEAGLIAASLLVVRLAGYRLVWHWPFRRPKP